MRLIIILVSIVFLCGCSVLDYIKPRVEIKTVQADSELIALALTPPRTVIINSETKASPPRFEVFVDDKSGKIIYQLTEDQALDLLDFIIDNNNAISQRNRLIYIYREHATQMKNKAEEINAELAK